MLIVEKIGATEELNLVKEMLGRLAAPEICRIVASESAKGHKYHVGPWSVNNNYVVLYFPNKTAVYVVSVISDAFSMTAFPALFYLQFATAIDCPFDRGFLFSEYLRIFRSWNPHNPCINESSAFPHLLTASNGHPELYRIANLYDLITNTERRRETLDMAFEYSLAYDRPDLTALVLELNARAGVSGSMETVTL